MHLKKIIFGIGIVLFCTGCYCYQQTSTSSEQPQGCDHVYVTKSVEPSCETEGYTFEECSKCGDVRNRQKVSDPHGHRLNEVPSINASCTANGHKAYYVCNTCNRSFEDSLGSKPIENVQYWLEHEGSFPKIDHKAYWVITKNPTLDETGLKHEECEFCHTRLSEDVVIPKTSCEHSMTPHDAVNPTCASYGVKAYYECTICNKFFEDSNGYLLINNIDEWKNSSTGGRIEKTSHAYSWVIDKSPTCNETGIKHEVCSNCNGIRSEGTIIPKDEHNHKEGSLVHHDYLD